MDDPDFTDADQEAGLRRAAKAILDVKSEMQLLVEVGIASPWRPAPPDVLHGAATSRFAGMNKTVTFSSARRTTLYESAANLQVFKVSWEVLENKTVLEAGTASGWLSFEGIDLSKAFAEARVLKKAARMIKDLEDFRSCVLTKPEDRIGGVPKGPIDACEVTIVNEQVRRVVSVEQDDADKVRQITHGALRTWLNEELTIGPRANNPGANIHVPGRDGLEARIAPGTARGLLGALAGVALEQAHHGLHAAQLVEHVVLREDLLHQQPGLVADPRRRTVHPVGLAAMAQLSPVLGQVRRHGAPPSTACEGGVGADIGSRTRGDATFRPLSADVRAEATRALAAVLPSLRVRRGSTPRHRASPASAVRRGGGPGGDASRSAGRVRAGRSDGTRTPHLQAAPESGLADAAARVRRVP